MKSYTDIEQSKVLAKILPIESADMFFSGWAYPKELHLPTFSKTSIKDSIPCWSLAALFKVISNIFKYNLDYNGTSFILMVGDFEVSNKTAVDACYEMIIRLNKLKML